MTATVKFVSTVDSKLSQLQIENGQLIFVNDTRRIYLDFNGIRTEYSQVILLAKEEDRVGYLTPINAFYFVNETEKKAQRLLFSVDEFNNGRKYFYPTIFSWNDAKGTTATCEYIKVENENGIVDLRYKTTTPKKTYATVTYSINTGLKKDDIKDAVIGFLIDDPAIDVKTDKYWADKLASTNKKISFLDLVYLCLDDSNISSYSMYVAISNNDIKRIRNSH